LLKTTDTNLDTKEGQKWIKDFAWRVTEELTEAQEAHIKDDNIHYIEEVIDALHFLVELSIIAGYDYKIVPENHSTITLESEWNIVYNLGLACNCLKNKAWKQTHILTDRKKFELYLEEAWRRMLGLLTIDLKLTKLDIYCYYVKKNEVNKFRIKSKY